MNAEDAVVKPEPALSARRVRPNDLPPDIRAKYEAGRVRSAVENALGLHGPPLDPDPTGEPFGASLRAFVAVLRVTRIGAGLTATAVDRAAGWEEGVTDALEAGPVNPAWRTLFGYATAVGRRLTATVHPGRPSRHTPSDIGGDLREVREAAGLTLTEVAGKTGLAVETLSRLETGAATNPTWQTLGRYAAAVGCTLTLTAEPAG